MEPPTPGVRIELLGGFAIRRGQALLSVPRSAQRLLAFLALNSRPLPRLYVAGILWPEMPERRAAADLRSALWRLAEHRNALIEGPGDLSLSPFVAVDLREAIERFHSLLEDPIEPSVRRGDLDRLNEELLPGWYEDWVISERDRFHQLRIHALESFCGRLVAAGQHRTAVEMGQLAVAIDPLRETAQRALMHAYAAEGNSADVIRQFRSYRELLRRELGIDPSPEIEALAAVR